MCLARSSPTVLTWFTDASSSGLHHHHSGTLMPPGASTPSKPLEIEVVAIPHVGPDDPPSADHLALGRAWRRRDPSLPSAGEGPLAQRAGKGAVTPPFERTRAAAPVAAWRIGPSRRTRPRRISAGAARLAPGGSVVADLDEADDDAAPLVDGATADPALLAVPVRV